MLGGLAGGTDSADGARRGERAARSSGRAGESVRGEARQLPHVMILPQVSDDVPRHQYHPVVNRTTADNREYTHSNDSPVQCMMSVGDLLRWLFISSARNSMSKSCRLSFPTLPPTSRCPLTFLRHPALCVVMCNTYLREEF